MSDHNVIETGRDLPARINTLLDEGDALTQIATVAADPSRRGEVAMFRTFDTAAIERIAGGMQEVNRAVAVFGRKNSQTTNKLMTLSMMNGTDPYRALRQCLAEISNRRSAIRETYYNLKRKRIEIEARFAQLDTMDPGYDRDLAAIDLESLIAETAETVLYFEGALKDIASFQSAYVQIRQNNGIPEDWDESNFESAEIRGHVRYAFLLTYRNLLARGTLDAGTLEYLHQFGIHPQRAIDDATAYIEGKRGGMDDYEGFEQWLDKMADRYGQEYLKAMNRIGLDTLVDEWAQYREGDPESTAEEMFRG